MYPKTLEASNSKILKCLRRSQSGSPPEATGKEELTMGHRKDGGNTGPIRNVCFNNHPLCTPRQHGLFAGSFLPTFSLLVLQHSLQKAGSQQRSRSFHFVKTPLNRHCLSRSPCAFAETSSVHTITFHSLQRSLYDALLERMALPLS